MSHGDRLLRSLFVALAVGLGWGIRGDFGHTLGASYPGAILGLAFAFVSGQANRMRWMPILGAVSALCIATGGMMSYGVLHGYAKSDTLPNYAYGFFTLVLQGGAWGTFGCGMMGLLLERNRVKTGEVIAAIATIFVSGMVFYTVVVSLIGFHINPPRSDLSIAFTGGAMGWFVWLARSKKWYGLRGAILGYLGFGVGMAFARFLGNASYLQPFPVNHWNIMEVGTGFFGGLVFTWGMLGWKFPDPPDDEQYPLIGAYGIVYVLALIPLLHRLRRIGASEALEKWTTALSGYEYANPEALSSNILLALNVVCLLAFLGAGFWLYCYLAKRDRFAWFPVMCLSGTMLLVQNLNALYFFYPRNEGSINMHFVFWVLFGLMALYVVFGKRRDVADADETFQRVPWVRWAAGAVAVYAIVVAGSAFVNGEETMASANTRWPLWNWRDGPFPGRGEAP